MKIPRFELTRVYEDGSREAPQIVPVTKLPWDVQGDRRGFLGAAPMAGAVLATARVGESAEPASDPATVTTAAGRTA
ncbi:MAG: hypothetical protein LBT74_10045 [Acidobacteriota bacterium]|jgi:hypothetical protein|nr:hypothetical protein [Acidobacteriota bacterium]